MNSTYRHLDEQTMEQYGNAWIPAIPLPYYHRSVRKAMSFKTSHLYVCGCEARFDNEAAYREHYRTEQMLEMNFKMARTRDLAKAKELYWRRRSFIFEQGTDDDKSEALDIETPEMKNLQEVEMLVAQITDIWGPVYRKYAEANDVTVGRVKDDTEITDEDPEHAANDMADKFYSHTNSKGVTYILHMREVKLRGGKLTPIYYFRKDVLHKDVCAELPEHLEVRENPRNGFLTVKRKDEASEPGHEG